MRARKTRRRLLGELGAAAAVGSLGAGAPGVIAALDEGGLPSRIAFGSCAHQDKPQPVLRTVVDKRPDLFIYLGDNIYGDTRDMALLRAKYDRLAAKPEFQALRASSTVLATWDDHDYGENDAGKEYPRKEESRQIFLDFWQVPIDSERRRHPGIYHEHLYRGRGRVLQVLLLDLRTFRDPPRRNPSPLPPGSPWKNAYQPDEDPGKTLMGAEQWEWLGRCLRRRADVRVICSSIQFGHEYNGWESWTNFPREQARMVDLIRETRARGVVFISGDVHWGEVSRRDFPGCYPLYDVTASGITETWPTIEPNRYRQGEVVPDNHFGMIDIDWGRDDPALALQVVDLSGRVRVRRRLPLSRLSLTRG